MNTDNTNSNWNKDYIEYCNIMNLSPNVRDEIIFIAGYSFALIAIDRPSKKWSKEQLENFLRHETTMSDDACKKLASILLKQNLVNLMVTSNPENYNTRKE